MKWAKIFLKFVGCTQVFIYPFYDLGKALVPMVNTNKYLPLWSNRWEFQLFYSCLEKEDTVIYDGIDVWRNDKKTVPGYGEKKKVSIWNY